MGMENYLNLLICGNLILIVNSKESDWLGGLIQTTDTLFPSGGYAHSYGLEEMVALEKIQSREDLEEFLIQQILPSLEKLELPYLGFCYETVANRDYRMLGIHREISCFV